MRPDPYDRPISGDSGETSRVRGPRPDGKIQVAVLGGGAAGITAAYELSKTKELRDAFGVTVYTNGWRLGGKGASGRVSDGPWGPHRVEEHGLHVWFGFYRNAFAMMEECYGAGCAAIPYTQISDAFVPIDQLVLTEKGPAGDFDGAGLARCVAPPARLTRELGPDDPRDPDEPVGDWRAFFTTLLQRIRELVEVARFDQALVTAGLDVDLLAAFDAEAEAARGVANRQAEQDEPSEELYDEFAAHLREAAVVAADLGSLRPGRRLREVAELAAAWVKILSERALARIRGEEPAPFDHLNGFELRQLLRIAGVSEEVLDSAPVRALYDLAFSYRGGNPAHPDVAAGVAIENVLNIVFRHEGEMMRKMRGGMGDVIFAPLYMLLRQRGVRFEFFSSVTAIGAEPPGRSGGARVRGVTIQRQARLAPSGRSEYQPLINYDIPGWPAAPIEGQLDDESAERLAGLRRQPAKGPAVGSPHWALEREHDPLGLEEEFELQNDDATAPSFFDEVVLAIPIGAHHEVAGGLLDAHQGLRDMVRQAKPVCTQAFQLWLQRDRRALGWSCPEAEHPLLGAYAKSFDTYLDMSHAIAGEGWPEGTEPGSLSFFCGVLADPPRPRKPWAGADWPDAHQEARGHVESFLAAHQGRSRPPFWEHFNFQADVGSLDRHYWRANSSDWERYATSHADAMDARLRPDGTRPRRGRAGRFANLALAGDWTYTPINAGAVESAVMSGIEAAATLIKRAGPPLEPPEVKRASWRRHG